MVDVNGAETVCQEIEMKTFMISRFATILCPRANQLQDKLKCKVMLSDKIIAVKINLFLEFKAHRSIFLYFSFNSYTCVCIYIHRERERPRGKGCKTVTQQRGTHAHMTNITKIQLMMCRNKLGQNRRPSMCSSRQTPPIFSVSKSLATETNLNCYNLIYTI